MRSATFSSRRVALSAVVAVAVLGSGISASATTKKVKPKPVCNLVTDAKGDADTGLLGANEDQAMDILSADVATNAKQITAVIRVAKLANPDTLSPSGIFYEFSFTGSSNQDGHPMYVQIDPTGTVWQGGDGTGVLDFKKNEIHITLPLSYFGTGSASVAPGPPLHNFTVYADVDNEAEHVPTTLSVLGDTAGPAKTNYVVGTPSCVTVGK